MQIRSFLNLIALLTAIIPMPTSLADADDALKGRIVGTWRGEYQWRDRRHPDSWIKALSEDHYRSDRRLTGKVDYTYPDREAHFSYEGRWDIRDGCLLVEVTQSSGGYLKPGTRTRDKIVSMSERQMELQTDDGEIIKLRKSN